MLSICSFYDFPKPLHERCSWSKIQPGLCANLQTCKLTDFRQALEANICRTRDGRHMTPGLSLSMKMSSSMSAGPNVQFLLVGRDTSFTLSITWAAVTTDRKLRSAFVIIKMRTKNCSYLRFMYWYLLHLWGTQSRSFWKCLRSPWERFHWQQWGEASGGCKCGQEVKIHLDTDQQQQQQQQKEQQQKYLSR